MNWRKLLGRKQDIRYRFSFAAAVPEEENKEIRNPGRGWYQLYSFDAQEKLVPQELIWSLEKRDALALVMIDIGAYRETEISEDGLENIRSILRFFAEAGKDMILRVVYDREGKGLEKEPAFFAQIMEHIRQLGPIIREYGDNILTMQGVLVGSWGEMHSSRYLSEEKLCALAEALWENCQGCCPLAVRRPVYWRILEQSWENCENPQGQKYTGKFGLFDDGMFASDTHLGTFSEEAGRKAWKEPWGIEEELDFENWLGNYVPCGGEAVAPVKSSALSADPAAVTGQPDMEECAAVTGQPDMEKCAAVTGQPDMEDCAAVTGQPDMEECAAVTGQPDMEKCAAVTGQPDMEECAAVTGQPPLEESILIAERLKKMHITYLNRVYDKALLDCWKKMKSPSSGIWKEKSCYDYISSHLGYRFVIRKVNLTKINLEIEIENSGFAGIYQETEVWLEAEEDREENREEDRKEDREKDRKEDRKEDREEDRKEDREKDRKEDRKEDREEDRKENRKKDSRKILLGCDARKWKIGAVNSLTVPLNEILEKKEEEYCDDVHNQKNVNANKKSSSPEKLKLYLGMNRKWDGQRILFGNKSEEDGRVYLGCLYSES